ncbi:hypothetical protein N658DRAFT_273756 [Parathielavia hyrcaniae]|uniref:Uncharacterized protein n=1 Tax=Parathielavia hyrcaniae TaxID=113614 RepID=A0AAN6T366_9PEZI|nr:hypothetical protein N658DRAFT_273756 [Parathielavia hyrcaniae]
MIGFILDGGYQTDVNVVDIGQFSPIWHAYHHGHWDAVDALLARGADINDDVGFGCTPLVDACPRGMYHHAVELIDRGADLNAQFHSPPDGINKTPSLQSSEGVASDPSISVVGPPACLARTFSRSGQMRNPRVGNPRKPRDGMNTLWEVYRKSSKSPSNMGPP